MKRTLLILSMVFSFNYSAQAQEVDDKVIQSLFCQGKGIQMSVERFESGIVGWTVVESNIGENQYMGFEGGGDGSAQSKEFYATDLGSDIHVLNKVAEVKLTDNRDGRESNFVLNCK